MDSDFENQQFFNKLLEVFDSIEDRALEVPGTEADQEYIMSDIERLAIKGRKLVKEKLDN